jgi:hypothetical protein
LLSSILHPYANDIEACGRRAQNVAELRGLEALSEARSLVYFKDCGRGEYWLSVDRGSHEQCGAMRAKGEG